MSSFSGTDTLSFGGLSAKSVRYIHTVIHSALEQAKKEGMVTVNVSDAVKLPKQQDKEIKYLYTEDVKTFLNVAKGTRHFPICFLALNTGLRRGELLGLRWKDVDMQKGSVSVTQGLVRTSGGLKFQPPKTRLSARTVRISQEVLKALKAQKHQQNQEKLAAGEAYNKELYLVFCNELGHPLCPRGVTRHFERLLRKACLVNITFHSLRHTFATISLQEGVDIKTTQENLGHHAAAFTLDVYSSVTSKMRKEAADKIGDLLASCLNNPVELPPGARTSGIFLCLQRV